MFLGIREILSDKAFAVFPVMPCLFNIPFVECLSVSPYICGDVFGFGGTAYSLTL